MCFWSFPLKCQKQTLIHIKLSKLTLTHLFYSCLFLRYVRRISSLLYFILLWSLSVHVLFRRGGSKFIHTTRPSHLLRPVAPTLKAESLKILREKWRFHTCAHVNTAPEPTWSQRGQKMNITINLLILTTAVLVLVLVRFCERLTYRSSSTITDGCVVFIITYFHRQTFFSNNIPWGDRKGRGFSSLWTSSFLILLIDRSDVTDP